MARTFTSTSYIEVPSDTVFDGADLSVSLFIKPTSLANSTEYFGRHSPSNSQGGWGLDLAADGSLSAYSKSPSASGGSFNTYVSAAGVLTAGQWNHVGLSISKALSAPFELYANGAQVATGTNGYVWDYGGAYPVRIGDSTDVFWSGMAGDIGEAAWWNQRLTAAEYAALGKGVSPMAIRPAALIMYLPLRN